MTIQNDNISMTRGDSESVTVTCEEIPFTEGDTVTMTVRESADSDIVLQIAVEEFNDGAAVIGLRPEDTESLDFGEYVYDIQLERADGTVTTLIPRKPGKLPKFTLTEEATY